MVYVALQVLLCPSWKTIIELLSIYKRLKAFESILHK
ncbi:SbmA/BacA-like family transporter [Acinetobacter baumannii]